MISFFQCFSNTFSIAYKFFLLMKIYLLEDTVIILYSLMSNVWRKKTVYDMFESNWVIVIVSYSSCTHSVAFMIEIT